MGPVPASALLHDRFRAADVPWVPTVPRPDRARADAADVRREEHDVRRGPAARALPDGHLPLPRTDVLEGGGRAGAERSKQELLLLRGVDPEQHQEWELDGDPGDVQA